MQASHISVKGNAMQHRRVHKASVREIWREDKRKIQLWRASIERAIDRASALRGRRTRVLLEHAHNREMPRSSIGDLEYAVLVCSSLISQSMSQWIAT